MARILLISLVFLCGYLEPTTGCLAQTIFNSGEDLVCGTHANGILAVNNVTQVRWWEVGHLSGGVFVLDVTVNSTSISLSYNITSTTSYRAKLTKSYSDVATIVISPPSVGGTLSGAAAYCTAGNGTLTLSGDAGSIIKWQKSVQGGSWTDFTNTSSNYTYSNLTVTTSYRVIVKNGQCPEAISSEATITIGDAGASGGTASGGGSFCLSASGSISLSGNSGPILRWQKSENNGSTWSDIYETTSTLSYNVTATTSYRAVVQGSVCPEILSTTATVNVVGIVPGSISSSFPGAPTPGDEIEICDPAILTTNPVVLSRDGTDGSIVTWEQSVDGGPWTSLSYSASSYTIPNAAGYFKYRIKIGKGSCFAYSAERMVIVPTQKAKAVITGAASFCGTGSGTVQAQTYLGYRVGWQESSDGTNWTGVSNTGPVLNYTVNETTYYRASSGCVGYTNSVKIEKLPSPVGGVATGGGRACGNISGTLQLSGEVGSIEAWEVMHDGDGWLDVSPLHPGETYGYVLPTELGRGIGTNKFRAKVSNACGVAYSTEATVILDDQYANRAVTGSTAEILNASGNISLVNSTGADVLKWQKMETTAWADIPNSANSIYAYTDLAQSTRFRALLQNGVCPSVYSEEAIVQVYTLTGPDQMGEEDYASLEIKGFSGTVPYWEYSEDNGSTWTTVNQASGGRSYYRYTHLMHATTLFRAYLDMGESGFQYTNAKQVTMVPFSEWNAFPSVAGLNYTKSQQIAVKDIKEAAQIDTLQALAIQEVTTFSDGEGRPVQQVAKQAAPTLQDMVGFSVYDNTGKVPVQYLPYVAATSNGNYQSAALQDQTDFYSNGPTDKVADSDYPFAKTVFEKSPLSRVLEQGAAGQEWQPGSGHTAHTVYGANDIDEVRLFREDGTSSAFYDKNELEKLEIIDPDNHRSQVFTDKSGRTILKKVHLDEQVNGILVDWLETYYIYNAQGRIKYMVSPKGVAALKAASWSFNADIKNQFVYEFVYHDLGRLVEKRVPGQAAIYYCYDKLDRLVLVQNGDIRPQNKWFCIKYDGRGRPIMQGLYTNTTYIGREAIQQNIIDLLYAVVTDEYFEEPGTALHGYTNQSFPDDNFEVLAVNYYDTYDFDRDGSTDYTYAAQSLAGEGSPAEAWGLPTGSKQIVLGTSNWLYNYIFYDAKGRVIQVRSNNHLSTAVDNLATHVYDFEGRVVTSKIYHNAGAGRETTVINRYAYDHEGRLLKIYQNNNNASADQLVAQYEYNALGQLVDKKLHNTTGTAFLQSVDYRYNIRGWLNSINNAQLSTGDNNDETGDYFGMELLYAAEESDLGNAGRFNGNISAAKWKGPGTPSGAVGIRSYKYAYDKSNRITAAAFQAHSGTGWDAETASQNETLAYDLNGNILGINRSQRKYEIDGLIPQYGAQTMDSLMYTYSSSMGDRLIKVEDASADPAGFSNGITDDTEYNYDLNGNVIADRNKGIDSVAYNLLGKPSIIKFADGRRIEYTYNAGGTKLTMKQYQDATLQNTVDYVGSFVYQDGMLSFFGSPEGRVVNKDNTLEYQYAIADQQGNTRVVFKRSYASPEGIPGHI